MSVLIRPAVFLFTLVVTTTGCRTATPLQNPASIAAAPETKLTEEAIRFALERNGWLALERQSGETTALFEQNRRKLWVRIAHDANNVRIEFVRAENLAYKEVNDVVTVHRDVNQWMKALQTDINGYILRGGAPPAAPPPAPVFVVPASPRAPGRRGAPRSNENLNYCNSGIDCGVGMFCKDRGDGIKLCMGKGARNDYCQNGIDCGQGMFCKDRGDGFKVCM